MDSCAYWFDWRTPIACPVGSVATSTSGGLGFFSWITILGSIYLLGGILYKRFVLNKSGIDQIPHLYFWHYIYDWIKASRMIDVLCI
jgi:cation-dependent mannose-6-phosphate receptor